MISLSDAPRKRTGFAFGLIGRFPLLYTSRDDMENIVGVINIKKQLRRKISTFAEAEERGSTATALTRQNGEFDKAVVVQPCLKGGGCSERLFCPVEVRHLPSLLINRRSTAAERWMKLTDTICTVYRSPVETVETCEASALNDKAERAGRSVITCACHSTT